MVILVVVNLVVLVLVALAVALMLHRSSGAGSRASAEVRSAAAMQEAMGRVGRLVESLDRRGASQHGEMVEKLAAASASTQRLAVSTETLNAALTNSRVRGQWGERMADDVLRAAGFVDGINYVRSHRLESGGVPDFSFPLPQGSVVHMDVKFPIDNYLRALDNVDTHDFDRFTKAFLGDVKMRITELDGRGYLDDPDTVDCVLIFVPNEAVYAFIGEHGPDLFDVALEHRVVLCSPYTLFGVLAVLRQATENFHLERTSNEILEHLATFSNEWDRFVDHMEKVEKQLATVSVSFERLTGTRKRGVERELTRIESLRSRHDAVDDPVEDAGAGESDRFGATGDAQDRHDAPDADGMLDLDARRWSRQSGHAL